MRQAARHTYGMLNRRRGLEAVERQRARRQREDDAARLETEVSELQSLRLEIEECSRDGAMAEPAHVKRVVVESAPALFFLPCHERLCKDGGHEITAEVMRALKGHNARFSGEHTCAGVSGTDGTETCGRVLRYVGFASYRPS
jgi:hypothetical protein